MLRRLKRLFSLLSKGVLTAALVILPVHHFCLALDREFMYDTVNQRDPFLSLIAENIEVSDLEEISVDGIKLEGIIFDPLQGSLAMVNGEIYRTSDFIGGFQVMEIGNNYIKIAKEDILHTIKLPDEDSKKPTQQKQGRKK